MHVVRIRGSKSVHPQWLDLGLRPPWAYAPPVRRYACTLNETKTLESRHLHAPPPSRSLAHGGRCPPAATPSRHRTSEVTSSDSDPEFSGCPYSFTSSGRTSRGGKCHACRGWPKGASIKRSGMTRSGLHRRGPIPCASLFLHASQSWKIGTPFHLLRPGRTSSSSLQMYSSW